MTLEYQVIRTILARIRSLGVTAKGNTGSDYQNGYIEALTAVIDLIEEEITKGIEDFHESSTFIDLTDREIGLELSDSLILVTPDKTPIKARRFGWTMSDQNGNVNYLHYDTWIEVNPMMVHIPEGCRLFMTRVEATKHGFLHNTMPA